MAKNSYEINYNDKRFTEVNKAKNTALKEANKIYDGMINSSDKFYQSQIDAVKDYGDTQSQLQQERTDFTIEQIEQQKDQAQKDFRKEQSAAYVDFQKQSNPYGVNAEQMAANGLSNSGYSESSKVSMYNTYQNRVAMAKESLDKAILTYNNSITEARLQNSSALAEIAFNTLQTSLELALQGFQYKNQLILAKLDKKAEIDDRYYNRYQNVLQQINTENSLAEQIRQFNVSHSGSGSSSSRNNNTTEKKLVDNDGQQNLGGDKLIPEDVWNKFKKYKLPTTEVRDYDTYDEYVAAYNEYKKSLKG